MNILIVGSEGFIGKALCAHFMSKGQQIIGCDLFDGRNLDYNYYKVSRLAPEYHEIFEKENIDICINAAGNGSVPVSIKWPLNDFEANCLDTFKILESIRNFSPSTKFLYISSAAVYGNPDSLPVRERDKIDPMSPYGWHKYYGELLCKEYHTLYQVRTCFLRPFSVYGPGLRKQLLWDLFLKSRTSSKIELFGTGNETRDFIYIDDLVQAIALVIERSPFDACAYNVASGTETSIEEIASSYLRSLNPKAQLSFNNITREGDPRNWRADITKIEKLGFAPKVSLKEGLSKTIAWQKEYGLE